MDKKVIGEKISTLRKEKGMTQKELAEKLCVTDKSVSKWETGVHFPDIAIMEQLANELGITVSDLLGLEQATSEEVVKGMAIVSEEEKNEIKKRIKWQSWQQILYGIIGFVVSIYLSWRLHLQGLNGGIYGGGTAFLMIVAMNDVSYGFYNLIKLKKL
ncbi:MAG: helix-turn-helix domain-containing protein [Agathobacter sp.]|nr:helix-turn-helix domain-containing protein [Agathobacter sp.]